MSKPTQTVRADQTLKLVVNGAHDVATNPVNNLPNPFSWSLSDASFGTLAPSDDTLTCVFTPSGKLGDVNVIASTNTDPNPADPALNAHDTTPVTVTAGLAVSFDVAASVQDTGADAAAIAAADAADAPPTPAPTPVVPAPVDTPAPSPVTPSPVPVDTGSTDTPAPAPADTTGGDAPAADAPAADTPAPAADTGTTATDTPAAPTDSPAPAADASSTVVPAPTTPDATFVPAPSADASSTQ